MHLQISHFSPVASAAWFRAGSKCCVGDNSTCGTSEQCNRRILRITLPVLAGLVLLFAVVFYFLRRRRRLPKWCSCCATQGQRSSPPPVDNPKQSVLDTIQAISKKRVPQQIPAELRKLEDLMSRYSHDFPEDADSRLAAAFSAARSVALARWPEAVDEQATETLQRLTMLLNEEFPQRAKPERPQGEDEAGREDIKAKLTGEDGAPSAPPVQL